MKTTLIILLLIPFGSKAQGSKGSEIHASVNHPVSLIPRIRTFYGVGLGWNIILRDTNLVSFKLGAELNYFHTWDEELPYRNNVHYNYAVLSAPAFVRLSLGSRFKVFAECGAYIGLPFGGQVREMTLIYGGDQNNPPIKEMRYRPYFSGLSMIPAVGLGARFPVSKSVDLVLKPEFAFIENRIGMRRFDGSSYSDTENSKRFFYVRICAGIHLKH